MSISFYSLNNNPVKIWGHLDRQINNRNVRPVHDHGNSIGIIGGASFTSTLSFLKKLGELSDDGNGLPFVLSSDPLLSKELLALERNSSFVRRGEDHQAMVLETLRQKRVFLEKSGVCCIVMPCHVSNSWHENVSVGCSVPFLNMGECVAMELKAAELKPLEAGHPLKIGLLGTDSTLRLGVYQDKLQKQGFEVVLPDKATTERIMIPALEALRRNDMEGAQNLLRIALRVLLVRAVSMVVLASDDIRELLPGDDPLLKKCVDPMESLARATMKWANSAGVESL
ncbi:aspartate racemase [Impatiens glandulifera]|uniref:aspartate racemase n=1 Tax=Impatiens glandulifera TaxID=253017 RepID=UPI001FB068B2|nr:aspartate racemase [Impatiens glandulifera]